MEKRKVHFVCRGNIYRSRLAEAYARSLGNADYEFSSSGIDAARYPEEYSEQRVRTIVVDHKLSKYFSSRRRQTTEQLLKAADIVVFMSHGVYRDASKRYNVDARKSTIWHVKDLWEQLANSGKTLHDKPAVAKFGETTYQNIIKNVDRLMADLTATSWADIVDEQNNNLGLRLPVTWANQRGLWRRGVHAVITTPNKRYLIEKRSPTIIFAPNHLDVSLGGGVDAGETPREALIREIKEELGISVKPDEIVLLQIHKWASYHPHYRKYSNNFLYAYHVALKDDAPVIRLQPKEVSQAIFISAGRLNTLLRAHRLKNIGQLSYGYRYYSRIIKLAKPYVR